jgi:hypothetical protein
VTHGDGRGRLVEQARIHRLAKVRKRDSEIRRGGQQQKSLSGGLGGGECHGRATPGAQSVQVDGEG